MKALVGAFNQEKALVGAFSVIVQPVVEPMEHYTALIHINTSYQGTQQCHTNMEATKQKRMLQNAAALPRIRTKQWQCSVCGVHGVQSSDPIVTVMRVWVRTAGVNTVMWPPPACSVQRRAFLFCHQVKLQ